MDPTSPAYSTSIFNHVKSSKKKHAQQNLFKAHKDGGEQAKLLIERGNKMKREKGREVKLERGRGNNVKLKKLLLQLYWIFCGAQVFCEAEETAAATLSGTKVSRSTMTVLSVCEIAEMESSADEMMTI